MIGKYLFSLLLTVSSFHVFSQDWIRVFGDNISVRGSNVIETYDKGYVIGAYILPDNITPKWGWILKTDINGEMLWEKKIYDGMHQAPISEIRQTNDGGYIICGSTSKYDPMMDPYIMKLNKCGEKEWCKIYNTPDNMDFARNILQLEDSGYISYFAYYAEYDTRNRIWLFRLDKNGELLWNNVYRDTLSSTINEDCADLLVTHNKKYVLTGNIYHEDQPGSNIFIIKPYWAIVDEDMKQWSQTIWGAFEFMCGEAFDSEGDSFTNIYGCGQNRSYQYNHRPILFKLNAYGDTLWHKDVMENTKYANAAKLTFLNDSAIVIGGGWMLPYETYYHSGVFKTDSIGYLLKTKTLIDNDYSPRALTKTFDNKIVIIGNYFVGALNWDLYMFKVNSDLEYDSIYTQPFTYDSLCETGIISDTINLDCDVVVNIPEEPEKETTAPLKIWPNPTTCDLHIGLPECIVSQSTDGFFHISHFNHQYQDKSALQFFDIFGRKVFEASLAKGQREAIADVSFLTNGIYIVRLVYKGGTVSSGRFVKR